MLLGVYTDKGPFNQMPSERLVALANEASRNSYELCVFGNEEVDFRKEEIHGRVWVNGQWIEQTTPFPDVLINELPRTSKECSEIERKLKNRIPFLTHLLGGKEDVYNKFKQSEHFKECTIPTFRLKEKKDVLEACKEYSKVIIKPDKGRQGQKVYLVQQEKNQFIVQEHKKLVKYTFPKFMDFVAKLIKEGDYLVQQYVHCRTNDGEPFDFRCHVQRNGEGKWEITRIYARIGQRNTILSNVSRGGRTEDLAPFLEKEYPEYHKQMNEVIRQLAIDFAAYINSFYKHPLSELGIDLSIDTDMNIWMYEINAGPQSKYHEEERAKRTIAYAAYIGKQAKPPIYEKRRMTIALLEGYEDSPNINKACAVMAKYYGVDFFYFTENDVDVENKLIKGYRLENEEWIVNRFEYPDVVYDRMRLRGIKGHTRVYQALKSVPFTNSLFGNSINKLELYDQLSPIEEIQENIIPYEKVTTHEGINKFIEKHQSIILKPQVGSFAKGVLFVSAQKGMYEVYDKQDRQLLCQSDFNTWLTNHILNKSYVVQKYIQTRTIDGHPFDVRVHLFKDGKNNWSLVKIQPRIGTNYATILVPRSGGYMANWDAFVKRNFGKDAYTELHHRIKEACFKIAKAYEKLKKQSLSEIAFDIAISPEKEIYLIELNVNRPGVNYYEFDLAAHAIPYAIYVAKNKEAFLTASNKVQSNRIGFVVESLEKVNRSFAKSLQKQMKGTTLLFMVPENSIVYELKEDKWQMTDVKPLSIYDHLQKKDGYEEFYRSIKDLPVINENLKRNGKELALMPLFN